VRRTTKGFLFDVDGTLTSYRNNDSKVDMLLVYDLEQIRRNGHPIGFVTGRSVDWVKNYFFKYVNDTLKDYIQIFGEFGLVSLIQGKKELFQLDKNLKSILQEIKKEITKAICNERDLEPLTSYSEPRKRVLWIEPKDIMITFRTMPTFNLTIEQFQTIAEPIIKNYPEVKIEANPYALDILPQMASKKLGAEKAIKSLDPENKIMKWFAFGDSLTDENMSKVANKEVEFTLVPRGDTRIAHELIQKAIES
jgi:HAD superfamily hydrolase (TIGR01484 family)